MDNPKLKKYTVNKKTHDKQKAKDGAQDCQWVSDESIKDVNYKAKDAQVTDTI